MAENQDNSNIPNSNDDLDLEVNLSPDLTDDDDTQEVDNQNYVQSDYLEVEILNDSSKRDSEVNIEAQNTVISKRPPVAKRRPKRDSEAVGQELEGSHLEHFELQEFVGGGGMGAVFRATDTKLGRTVAVKVLSQNQQAADALRRFKNEAQSAARLDHGNIARVYYVGEDRGWHFIVFEYIHGVNIRDLVEHRGPLPLDEALSYVVQLADALQHAASRDVVHRDIKPSNILITTDGSAKLVDMGLARFEHLETDNSDMTASGVTLGTFDYISPEQARDPRSTDVRSDLYSLGCTLYFMLTGVAPYPQGTVLQKLLSHSSEPPPDPRLYREDIDDHSLRLLHKMLAKRPDDRHQSPAMLIRELLDLGDRLGIPLSTTTQLMLSRRGDRQFSIRTHIPWVVSASILLAGAFMVNLLSSQTEPVIVARPAFLKPSFIPPTPSVTPSQPNSTDETDNSDSVTSDSTEEMITPPNEDGETISPQEEGIIIVGDVTSPVPPNTRIVDTLEQAINQAKVSPQFNIIEITGDSSTPLPVTNVNLTDIGNNQLMIRGAKGDRPSILIVANEEDIASTKPVLFHISDGSLTFENVVVTFQLPAVFRQRWTLFGLQDVNILRFSDCILQVIPGDPTDAEASHINVAMFDAIAPNEQTLASDESTESEAEEGAEFPEGQSSMALYMERTIIRGDCTFARCNPHTSLQVTWTDGWLATNQWLLDVQSSDNKTENTVSLSLNHVSTYCAEGLIRVDGNAQATSPPQVSINATRSLFITPPEIPIVLIDGVTLSSDTPFRPQITLRDSLLMINSDLIAVRHRDAPDTLDRITYETVEAGQNTPVFGDWFQSVNTLDVASVIWLTARAEFAFPTPHSATTNDFLIEGNDESEPDSVAGFRSATLPATQ